MRKVIKEGTVNGHGFVGEILNDTVPIEAVITLTDPNGTPSFHTNMFPSIESATSHIFEAWHALKNLPSN